MVDVKQSNAYHIEPEINDIWEVGLIHILTFFKSYLLIIIACCLIHPNCNYD